MLMGIQTLLPVEALSAQAAVKDPKTGRAGTLVCTGMQNGLEGK